MTSTIQKILLATDGSEVSLLAADYAAEIARCTGASTVILNAAESTAMAEAVVYVLQPEGKLDDELRGVGMGIIARASKPFTDASLPAEAKIVSGHAADVILSEARSDDYDMIIMGSIGAGGGFIKRVVLGLGSVAQKVLANAPCPVLVVKKETERT